MTLFLPFAKTFPYPNETPDVFEMCRNQLEDLTTRNSTSDEVKRVFGRTPFWFLLRRAPPYPAFVVGALDGQDRQYMSLNPAEVGIRLPIGRPELIFPEIGETISITPKGTGQLIPIYIHHIALPRNKNPRTAILMIKYL